MKDGNCWRAGGVSPLVGGAVVAGDCAGGLRDRRKANRPGRPSCKRMCQSYATSNVQRRTSNEQQLARRDDPAPRHFHSTFDVEMRVVVPVVGGPPRPGK